MEILFKSDYRYFYLTNNYLRTAINWTIDKKLLDDVKHLDNVEVLYHYKDNITDRIFSVYYEHGDNIISRDYNGEYVIYNIKSYFLEKDYTLVNLKILDNGDIV